MKRIAIAVVSAVGLVLCGALSASAQVTETLAIGGLCGLGYPGSPRALRISSPLGQNAGLDVDLGHVRNSGVTYGANLRWYTRERSSTGGSRYLAIGFAHLKSSTVGSVTHADGTRTLETLQAPWVIPQFSIGGDTLWSSGTRLGVEATIGSGGHSDTNLFVKFFLLFGSARH